MIDPATAEWLNGPKLMAWLEERQVLESLARNESYARRAAEWRKGGAANVYTVDAMLLRLGLHLSLVPNDCYCEPPRKGTRGGKPYTEAERRRAVALLRRGRQIYEVSVETGICERTVRMWRDKEGISYTYAPRAWFLRAAKSAKRAGFTNRQIGAMFGCAPETARSWVNRPTA